LLCEDAEHSLLAEEHIMRATPDFVFQLGEAA
jgi:hypothetical protein